MSQPNEATIINEVVANNNLEPIRFHFHTLKFTPYNTNQENHTSVSILKDVMTYIMQEKVKGKGHLIDRNQNRNQEPPRPLFMSLAVIMHREKRIRCSLALLRSGRMPMIKQADTFVLMPLEKGSIAEETHFWIDFSTNNCYMCVEFNPNGPRLSDIEFYLRSVSSGTLRISKSLEITTLMNTSIDKTLAQLKNVLNIDIKMAPQNITQLDNALSGYLTSISTIGQKLKPKFIKIEAMFQASGKSGKSIISSELNTGANTMVKLFIEKFRSNPTNIDCFENFVVRYEDKDGQEEVFNLLKGKKELIKDVDLKKVKKERDLYELIEKDFDAFIENL